jgi:hypothetical protein
MPVRTSLIRTLFASVLDSPQLAAPRRRHRSGPVPACPTPPIERPINLPRRCPVKSIKIDTKISSQVATHARRTDLSQPNQRSRSKAPISSRFPRRHRLRSLRFGRRPALGGEVRTREEARRIYDEIVRRQRDPGLLGIRRQGSVSGEHLSDSSQLRKETGDHLHASRARRRWNRFLSYPLGTGRQ